MRTLYWNCRGVSNIGTRRVLKELCLRHKPDILCLAEPMCLFSSIPVRFWKSIGFSLVAQNDKPIPSLWVLCSSAVSNFQVLSLHPQHVSSSFVVNGILFYVSFVYASCNYILRRDLWDSLSALHIVGPWLALGDFNSVMGAHETTGILKRRSCEDFRAGITLCDLVDLDSQGPFYTWQGFRKGHLVMSRLDRAFCNDDFLNLWNQVSSICLPRSHSDHHPLLLTSLKDIPTGPRPFRFQGMWLSHPTFMDLVRNVWSRSFFGSPFTILVNKLKALKRELKVWNWEVFGDLKLKIARATQNVSLIQERLGIEGFSDPLLKQETEAHPAFDILLSQEEIYLREQSRVKWLKEGDRNSSFFHNVVKRRRAKKTLCNMKIGDELVDDMDLISTHIQTFYEDLFRDSHSSVSDFSM
ncbi:Endonuclease/exonuclease/phosphatase, partial [Trema orientale]